MSLREAYCLLRRRHRHELMVSAGTHAYHMECLHCGRSRVVDLDTGKRPIPFVPVKRSLAPPTLADKWGRP